MLTKIFDFILEVLELLKQALLIFIHRNRAVRVIFYDEDGKEIESMITLPDNTEGKRYRVRFVDVRGNDAPVDGVPVWASSDESLMTVVADADGMAVAVTTPGPLGTLQFSVKGDADLGAGITEVIGLEDVNIVPSQAVAAVISPEP